MRKGLIVLLSLGVVVGFGSGFARIAHRGGGCHERWGNEYDGREGRYDRFDRYDRNERFERGPAPVAAPVAAAPAPVYIVIPQPAAQAAPIIVNGPAPLISPAPAAAANPQPAPAAQ